MKFEVSLWQFTPRTEFIRQISDAIFYCVNVSYLQRYRAIKSHRIARLFVGNWFLAEREAIAFLFKFKFHSMPRTNEICKGAKHSNTNARQFHETKRSLKEKIRNLELREKIECDEKNFAYSFILSQGYYHEFAEYHRKNHGKNGHGMCLNSLLSSL